MRPRRAREPFPPRHEPKSLTVQIIGRDRRRNSSTEAIACRPDDYSGRHYNLRGLTRGRQRRGHVGGGMAERARATKAGWAPPVTGRPPTPPPRRRRRRRRHRRRTHSAHQRRLTHHAALRGTSLRLVPTRANTQPAFGCYLPSAQTPIARPYGMIVLTLRGDQISAITWFSDSSAFPHFGLPAHCRGRPDPGR